MATSSPPPSKPNKPVLESHYLRSLLAGALAGTTVDTALYPLDTLKTRLQSRQGFFASGGFRGVYNGIGSAFVGSAPGAALFFVSYDSVKRYFRLHDRHDGGTGTGRGDERREVLVHMLAASVGEVAACAVRVPTEVVKQRAQADGRFRGRSGEAWRSILALRHTRGWGAVGREMYRGWGVTVLREVPFTVIQFPLWEAMKRWSLRTWPEDSSSSPSMRKKRRRKEVGVVEGAVYGSLSGAVAASLTTPLDVLKTRLMLASKSVSVWTMTGKIWREEGPRVFFSGIGPRTMWISIGGAVFLGSYQWAANFLEGI